MQWPYCRGQKAQGKGSKKEAVYYPCMPADADPAVLRVLLQDTLEACNYPAVDPCTNAQVTLPQLVSRATAAMERLRQNAHLMSLLSGNTAASSPTSSSSSLELQAQVTGQDLFSSEPIWLSSTVALPRSILRFLLSFLSSHASRLQQDGGFWDLRRRSRLRLRDLVRSMQGSYASTFTKLLADAGLSLSALSFSSTGALAELKLPPAYLAGRPAGHGEKVKASIEAAHKGFLSQWGNIQQAQLAAMAAELLQYERETGKAVLQSVLSMGAGAAGEQGYDPLASTVAVVEVAISSKASSSVAALPGMDAAALAELDSTVLPQPFIPLPPAAGTQAAGAARTAPAAAAAAGYSAEVSLTSRE